MSARVLVTGATGTTGRPLAAELARRGLTVRTASRGAPAPEHRGEHVRFDWSDPTTHAAALDGVDRMYLIGPELVVEPDAILNPFIDRALACGLRRVVLLSSSIIPDGAPGLGRVHAHVRANAPEWAVLQPSWFMHNFINPRHHHLEDLTRDDVLVTATGDGRVSFVDPRDIAAVAARALADARAHDTAHLITGPAALSHDDIAAQIARVVGRPIRHLKVSVAESVRHMERAGIPEPYARLLADLEDQIRRGDEGRVSDAVERITGTAPRSFEAFAREHAAHWRAPT